MGRRTIVLLILLIVIVVGVGVAFGLSSNSTSSEVCKGVKPGNLYHITIYQGKASMTSLTAHLCDTLTFTNLDNVTREIAFGPHEHHVPYDGIAQKFLNKNQSFTITFNAVGNYHWHDHLHDWIIGVFVVKK